MKNKKLIVLGATGYTGQIICSLLDKEKMPFSILGRNIETLESIKNGLSFCDDIVVADLGPDNIDEFKKIESYDIYINCIGPFSIYSKSITKYLSNKNCIYLDITGEQSFIRYSQKELIDDIGKNRSLFIHSNSFESSLVLLLADQICEKSCEYKSIDSFYGFKSGAPSPGTRATMKIHHYFDQYITKDHQLTRVDQFIDFKDVKFRGWVQDSVGYFTPFPEVIFLNDIYRANEIGSYTLMSRFDAEMTRQMEQKSKKGDLDKTLKKLSRSSYTGPSALDRSTHEFFIGIRAITKDGKQSNIELLGCDMYKLTAALMVDGLKALLQKSTTKSGIFPLSEVIDSSTFLEGFIKDYNLELTKY